MTGALPVQVPQDVFADLVAIARYVSLGRRAVDHQPGDATYPDSTARFALGALREAGLLPEDTPLLSVTFPESATAQDMQAWREAWDRRGGGPLELHRDGEPAE